jgi:hypothetical protein
MNIQNLNLSRTRHIHNENGHVGVLTPGADRHGNPLTYATTAHRPDDEMVFHTAGAAEFWVNIVAEIVLSRKRRGL